MSSQEEICRPLVHSLCEIWYFAKCGNELDMRQVDHDIREQQNRIRDAAEDDPRMKREFQRIERALVFFIDYTIKEGRLSFSDDWRELARDYDELSGDEKFFEMLSESLDDPDSSERLMMYYLFMGLGFDGVHFDDRDFIQRRMKVCATRFQLVSSADKKFLSSPDVEQAPAFTRKRRFQLFSVRTALILCAQVLFVSFVWNLWSFVVETRDFDEALSDAVVAAEKHYLNRSTVQYEQERGE